MKVKLKKDKKMDMVNSIILIKIFMKDNGKTISCNY
jgi:hypothetical protein